MIESPVLVTGASGFVGRHLAARWAAAGVEVRALVRPGREAPAGTVRVEAMGLEDHAALARAAVGVRAVVHLAARVHVMRERSADPLAEFRRVNVAGTRAAIRAAAAAGARAFVLASSVKAVGESTPGAPWTDDIAPRPESAYGISKREAEAVVREEGPAAGLRAVSLRFPLIYGGGVGGNMGSLLALIHRGIPLPLASVRNRRSLLYVGNAAAAVEAVLASPAAAGKAFFVRDGEDLSTPELVRRIAAALGRPARLVPVPPALFRAAGLIGDGIARYLPVPRAAEALDRLLGSLAVDDSRLRELGYVPPFTVDEGLRATAADFLARHR